MRRGSTHRVLAWLWPAGEDIRPAVAAGVELGISSLAHLDAVLAAGPRPDRPAEGAPEDRHRAGPQRGRTGRTGPVLDALAAAQRAGRVAGRWPDEPPGQRGRARRSVGRRADRDLPGRHRARRAGGHPGRHQAPGEHPGRARSPGHLLRPRPVRHRDLRPQPGGHPGRAAARDDPARHGRADQTGTRRLRRLLRPDLSDRRRHHPGAGAARLRRRHSAGGQFGRRGAARRQAAADRRPGGDGPGGRRLR